MSAFTEANVWALIKKAVAAFPKGKKSERCTQAFKALYKVRNKKPGYLPTLLDANDEVMAAAEHYLMCRAWVGSGKVPAYQMSMMAKGYNAKKQLMGVARANPDNPATPVSQIQECFQIRGIMHGERDRAAEKNPIPLFNASVAWKSVTTF